MSSKTVGLVAGVALIATLALLTLSPPGALRLGATRTPPPGPAASTHAALGAKRTRPSDSPFKNRALALGWRSAVETQFDTHRLAQDHTTWIRFMAAYEAAFRGVILADGTGDYRLGLAPYSSLGRAAIEVAVGGASFTHPLSYPVLTDNDFRNGVPRQPARRWRQIALTRTAGRVAVYLDGARVGHFAAGEAPETGTLRLGRLANPGEVQDQFYGFIDDVSIFDRALEDSEIAALSRKPRLDGSERNLIAAWLFDQPIAAKGATTEPFTLLGTTRLRELSPAPLDAADSSQLPKPEHENRFTLPFAEGQVWMVIQGMNSALSHNDSAAFALDFLRVEPGLVAHNAARLPGGSHAASAGAPFLAPADGKVVARVDCFPNDNRGLCPAAAYREPLHAPAPGAPANRNLLCLEHGLHEVSCALHLRAGSARAALGERVPRGKELAEVGKTGARTVHLHFAVSDLAEPSTPGSFAPLVTFPFLFSEYQVSTDFGATWRQVSEGMPNPGEWVRRAR